MLTHHHFLKTSHHRWNAPFALAPCSLFSDSFIQKQNALHVGNVALTLRWCYYILYKYCVECIVI
jgi:hypothetical protein